MNIKDWLLDVVPFRQKRTSFFLPAMTGLGVGLVAGIGLGLLFAPSTGEEARLRLREGASRVRNRATDLAARAKSQLAGAAEQIQARS